MLENASISLESHMLGSGLPLFFFGLRDALLIQVCVQKAAS
jgi:hypothetical protein